MQNKSVKLSNFSHLIKTKRYLSPDRKFQNGGFLGSHFLIFLNAYLPQFKSGLHEIFTKFSYPLRSTVLTRFVMK